MKKFFLYSLFIIALALSPSIATANEYGGVGGRPANPREDNPRSESIFIYELEPGQSVTDGVQVFNNTDTPRTVRIGAVDGALSSSGAFACAQENDSKIGVGSWIELEQNTVQIPARDDRTVNFTITVPLSANVGEQGGCITLQDTQAEGSEEQGGIVLTFRSAIRVAVTIPGEIVKAISFGPIEFGQSKNDGTLYVATPSVLNNGNVSLDTDITTRIVSLFGLPVDETQGTYPVLPASTASWNFEFDAPFWGGLYRADVSASYNSNTEDTLGQESSDQRQTVRASSAYVFIPPAPLAAVAQLAVLGLIIAGLGLLFRRIRHQKIVAKRWHTYTAKEGDSIQKIAKARHISWKKLATANKLKAPYHLEPGHKLKIPPAKD
jgi:hypothetical protein